MPRGENFGPVRPQKEFDRLNPEPFDTRLNIFVPDQSITDAKVRRISVRKIQMLGAKVYRSTAQTIADDGNWHNKTFNTTSFDEGNLARLGVNNDRLTLPYAGVWTISGFVSYVASAVGNRFLRIQKNGSFVIGKEVLSNPGGVVDADMPVLVIDAAFDAGDYVELQCQQGSGGDLDVNGGATENFFSAMFRGPI